MEVVRDKIFKLSISPLKAPKTSCIPIAWHSPLPIYMKFSVSKHWQIIADEAAKTQK